MNTLTGITHTIGRKIFIPAPNNNDTWEKEITSYVDKLYSNGMIVFHDDNSNNHEIDMGRVQFL